MTIATRDPHQSISCPGCQKNQINVDLRNTVTLTIKMTIDEAELLADLMSEDPERRKLAEIAKHDVKQIRRAFTAAFRKTRR